MLFTLYPQEWRKGAMFSLVVLSSTSHAQIRAQETLPLPLSFLYPREQSTLVRRYCSIKKRCSTAISPSVRREKRNKTWPCGQNRDVLPRPHAEPFLFFAFVRKNELCQCSLKNSPWEDRT